MTVTANPLTTGADTTDAVSFTTASITPGANRLVLAAVLVTHGTDPPAPSLSGNGLTWELVANTTLPNVRELYLFRSMGSAPTAGGVTISGDGVTAYTSALWQITEFGGVDTSGTNGSGAIVQSVGVRPSAATSCSAPFTNTVNTANTVYGAVAIAAREAITAGSGWTASGLTDIGSPASALIGEYALSALQNITASWTTSTANFIVGAEVKVAASTGVTGTGSLTATPATASGSGTVTATGSGTLTAAPATLTGSGTATVTGSGSLTAATATASGTGTTTVTGSGTPTAESATVSGSGTVTATGSGTLTAAPATLSGSGTVGSVVTGTGDLTAPAATATGAGTTTVTGTGALTPTAAALSGTGTLTVVGAAELTAQAATLAASGLVPLLGSGALTAAPATLSGTGVSGAPTVTAQTFIVPAESRVLTVPAESRVVTVAAEARVAAVH